MTRQETDKWQAFRRAVDEHVRTYRETDGADGYIWNGATTLLLTTRGRRSGEQRTIPLIFGRDADDFIVVASLGGAPRHPAWYLNITAHPRARVQVQADVLDVVARTASDDEKPRLWQIMLEVWPSYADYQARTDRVIPVVVLSPAT